jgi:hypothetical protein
MRLCRRLQIALLSQRAGLGVVVTPDRPVLLFPLPPYRFGSTTYPAGGPLLLFELFFALMIQGKSPHTKSPDNAPQPLLLCPLMANEKP